MADEATLRDVTQPNPPVAADTKEPVVAKPAETTGVTVVDAEAAEIGRIMLDSGYTRDKVNEVLQAPQALNTLRHLINNNPQEFLNLVERTDPATGEKFLETMADTYVKRYAPKGTPTDGKTTGTKSDPSAELMSEVAALREQVQGFQSAEQQRQNTNAMAQIKSRYESRVDDLFGQLPKELNLNKSEKAALRAQLSVDLGTDPNALQRVANGNFVDVPNRFKTIVDGWTGDRKAAADAEKTARDKVSNSASVEFSNGPNPFMVDVPASAAESWDATEDALAAAMTKLSR